MTASWMIALGLVLTGAGPSGRWLGQDGHDLTSNSSVLEPNGYQDIHIVVTGLPPERTIQSVIIRPYGGGQWEYNGNPGSWRAALERAPGSATAHLYMESDRAEVGREFQLTIQFDGGTVAEVAVKGGKSDPNRRMPKAAPVAKWVGQDRQDVTGAGPSVGPDGLQDVRIALANLSPGAEIKSVSIEAGARWQAGTNPKGESNAELVRDAKDPTRGSLFFQPDRDLAGRSLTIKIGYSSGKADTIRLAGERTDPKLPMPPQPLPNLGSSPLKAQWAGQDGANGSADVHIALSGLSTKKMIEAAVLSDSVRGVWVFRRSDGVKLEPVPGELPLVLKVGSDPSKADLFLPPYRDERGATFTLRLISKGGEMSVARFAGGQCDPFRGLPAPASSSAVARPGDDLQDLVNRHGTVTLAAGTHRLSRPLVLEKPITLAGERGAVIEFSQKPSDAPWTAAIKIHSGSTTLRDFAVRFVGRWRWDREVSYGPAVIGVTDNKDAPPPHPDPKRNLTFSRLDLVSSEPSGEQTWEEAPRLMRLVGAGSGRVDHCILTGGQIEFFGGPWQFVENESRGTPAGTYNHAVIVGHLVHDVLIQGNRVKPAAGSGKVWRFVVLTGKGHSVRVEGNTVEGVGPRDDDTIPSMNAPEIILTESYRIAFEGRVSAVSTDGRVIRIGPPQGTNPEVGDVVSILAGPAAGQWRTIAQAITQTSFLLDAPLPKGTALISIGSGFLDTRFEGNTIDCRGGKATSSLVLAGNHFGTVVRKNRFHSGGEALRIMAAPTEAPMSWGWSHAPYLGGIVEENILEDSIQGGVLGVEHNQYIKSNVGRTYMSLVLRNNTIRWTEAFLRDRQKSGDKTPLRGITLGYAPSLDPGELLVTEEGNRLEAPPSARARECLHVNAARFNGRTVQNKGYVLPAASADSRVSRANPR